MGRPAKFDDDEILDRAMALVWEHGWSHTSIRDLEDALDLKAPSIYRRYGSKEGLTAAVVEHYVHHVVRRRVDKYLTGAGDPILNISTFLVRSVTQAGSEGRLWGCLLTTTALEVDSADAALIDALTQGQAMIEAGLRGEVRRASQQERLVGIDADSAVDTLVLAMQGLMALARSGTSATELQRRARSVVSMLEADSPARRQ